jgi:aryl-alcohol dehydrogenase-like predicted oxidoreductase
MLRRRLGSSQLELSEVALGTWGLASGAYGPVTEAQFERTLDAALDAGVTTLDMAPLWGDGRSEAVVGRRCKDRRDELEYVTRAGATREDGALVQSYEDKALEGQLDESLKRLKTDRVDLWLMHNLPEGAWAEGDVPALTERLTKAGKIRAWGASVATAAEARMALDAGARALCLPYNLLASDTLEDVADEVRAAGAGVLASSPLAYGLLSGRWSVARYFPVGDHRRDRWSRPAFEARVRHVETLRFLVRGEVSNMASAAIRYVLTNPLVTSAVVGAKAPHQATAAAEAASGGAPYLPEEDVSRVTQVLAAAGG